MKSIKKMFVVLASAVCLSFALSSCSGSGKNVTKDDFYGDWVKGDWSFKSLHTETGINDDVVSFSGFVRITGNEKDSEVIYGKDTINCTHDVAGKKATLEAFLKEIFDLRMKFPKEEIVKNCKVTGKPVFKMSKCDEGNEVTMNYKIEKDDKYELFEFSFKQINAEDQFDF